ncbi:RDD family protein [Leptolyngbya sp. FACHB-541]|nr:RDD family protein [Leptolyngbya sp. FACHB-541]
MKIQYFGYFWSCRGRSIGMGMMNIKVVKTDYRSLSFLMAGLRGSIGYYLSSLIFWVGCLWFFVDTQQQTWHDKIFNTIVLEG